MLDDDRMRSIVLEWSRYKAVRSIVFCLRQNAVEVSTDAVAALLRHLGRPMHRAALCRYLRVERHESRERLDKRRLAAMTEEEWSELLASGKLDPRPPAASTRPRVAAAPPAVAAPQMALNGTDSEPVGNRREPEIEHKNESEGTEREPFTGKREKIKENSRSFAYAQLRPTQASEAVAEDSAQGAKADDEDAGRPQAAPVEAPVIMAEPMPAAAPTAPRAPKQGKLTMPPPPEKIAAGRLLDALWERVQPVVGRAKSRGAWRKANIVAAVDLVTARARGGDPDAVIDSILVEHERASLAAGSPLYSVARLQRELIAGSVPSGRRDRSHIAVKGETEYRAQVRELVGKPAALRRMLAQMTREEREDYIARNPEDAKLAGYA